MIVRFKVYIFFAGKPILVPLTSSVSTYDFSTIFWDSFWGGQGVIVKYHLQQYHLRIPLFWGLCSPSPSTPRKDLLAPFDTRLLCCGPWLVFYTKMYVPGKLKDTSKVLVDVGTGFYIEKVLLSYVHNPGPPSQLCCYLYSIINIAIPHHAPYNIDMQLLIKLHISPPCQEV